MMWEHHLAAVAVIATALMPFLTIPEVEEWRRQYADPAFEHITRFKFLVLEGESRWGKTRFACALFGILLTYVCQCQGVKQPHLSRYDRRRHKAIVLDEPSAELVENCKAFLQAGVDGCELYQSPTQRFTRWFCVYKVPIIICTNQWFTPDMDPSLVRWIKENSVHYYVNDYLYEHPSWTFL